MPAAQAFVDTLPGAPTDAAADSGERDATRRRRRRGGRGRGRDEGTADGMSDVAVETQGSEQAVDSAPIAAESVMPETPSAAETMPTEPRYVEEVAEMQLREAAPAPAPVTVPAPTMAAPQQPVPAAAARAPVAAPYHLPTDTLAAIASDAGLQWVNSDADKIRAVQEAMASEPKPAHAPRQPKPRAVPDDGPLVLVETKKDLSQVRLPFDA